MRKNSVLSYMTKNAFHLITALATVVGLIVASLSLCVSSEAKNMARESNGIATQANTLSSQSNDIANIASQTAQDALALAHKSVQPTIDGKCVVTTDADGNKTDSIIFVNKGEPIAGLVPSLNIYLAVITSKVDTPSVTRASLFLYLFNYYGAIETSTDSADTLFTAPGKPGNRTKLERIISRTTQEAGMDHFIAIMYLVNHVRLDFRNKLDEQGVSYYSVDYMGAFKKTSADLAKVQDAAYSQIPSAISAGVMPDIDTLDGTKLWQWCRGAN